MISVLCITFLAIGYAVGLYTGFSAGKKMRPAPQEAICGCGHHLAYHDPAEGKCWNYQPGVVIAGTTHKVTCKCRQYTGPELLAGFISRPLSDPGNTGN